MPRDPLSRTLELIDARTIYAGGFICGGDWSIRFAPPRKIKFFAVGRGSCLLSLDGSEPLRLETGDIFLLRRNAGYTVASDLSLPPIASTQIVANAGGMIIPVGQGEDFLFLGGHIDSDQAGGRLLTESLPDFVHIPAAATGAGHFPALIAEMVEEAVSRAPGAQMACSSLAQLLLIQILRRHLSSAAESKPGWLRVAGDPRFAPALSLMHGDLARTWTLAELSRACAMSRTAFATQFRAVAGMPPLTYLTEWRMLQADRELRRDGSTVARVAQGVGYSSEAAFSTAFKRVMGRPPRREARVTPPTQSPAISMSNSPA